MLKEYTVNKQWKFFLYYIKNTYIYINNVNDNLLLSYNGVEFIQNNLVVFNRGFKIEYVYKKLSTFYYYKTIPEFFLPRHIQLFIFRSLYLKQLFFLSYLFLLRHVTYRLAMKKLVLRYFYIRKLKYYFSTSSDNNFKYLISSEKLENFEIKQQVKFNVIDFLYFDFLLL